MNARLRVVSELGYCYSAWLPRGAGRCTDTSSHSSAASSAAHHMWETELAVACRLSASTSQRRRIRHSLRKREAPMVAARWFALTAGHIGTLWRSLWVSLPFVLRAPFPRSLYSMQRLAPHLRKGRVQWRAHAWAWCVENADHGMPERSVGKEVCARYLQRRIRMRGRGRATRQMGATNDLWRKTPTLVVRRPKVLFLSFLRHGRAAPLKVMLSSQKRPSKGHLRARFT